MCFFLGLRGCTADVIVLEEAAHLKPQLFHNVIVPLLTVEHTAMLAITSPGDEQNYISVIQDLQNADGEPLFYNIKIGMMCEKCLKEGKEKCKHELKRLPNWKSESRHDIVRAVYGQNQEAMKREAEGLIVSNRVYLFGKKDVDALAEREAYQFEYDVQLIEIGIDPSGGGANSDYTIVSKCVENGKDIVRIILSHYNNANISRTRVMKCPVLRSARLSPGLNSDPFILCPAMKKAVISLSAFMN